MDARQADSWGDELAEPLAIMGEIQTGLLHNSVAVSATAATGLLDSGLGEYIRRSERPIGYALSPDQLIGVDCDLPTSTGARARGVGTVVSRAVITGGHVVQGSAHLVVTQSPNGRRMPWSYYLARPGQVESLHSAHAEQLIDGFLAANREGTLDLTAISERALDGVQSRAELDHRTAFRAPRTQLRWIVEAASQRQQTVGFHIVDPTTRTLRLPRSSAPLADQVAVCEDLALHDWLLTTLLSFVERSGIGTDKAVTVLHHLSPAINFLLHLWMPAARVRGELAELWRALEQDPGMSRQWQVNVDRIRDHIALTAIQHVAKLDETRTP